MNEDIISFEYFEELTANWNRTDLLRRCYDLCNEMVEKQKEIERLKEENGFLKLSNPEMNLEHWRVVDENKRKIDNLRKHNKKLKSQLQQKENIIKEVREIVKWAYKEDEYQGGIYTIEQILDKENK